MLKPLGIFPCVVEVVLRVLTLVTAVIPFVAVIVCPLELKLVITFPVPVEVILIVGKAAVLIVMAWPLTDTALTYFPAAAVFPPLRVGRLALLTVIIPLV
jgi:hypothetical protein